MSDLFEQAHSLAERIKSLKEELSRAEDDYSALISQIKTENAVSESYYLSEQKTKKVNTQYFFNNMPEYYRKHAHVPHAYAVSIMSKKYGSVQMLQEALMDISPDEFMKHATITVSDVSKDFSDMDSLVEAGALSEEVKGYVVKPKLLFQIQHEQKGEVQ